MTLRRSTETTKRPKRKYVRVTEQHIAKGSMCSDTSCPVALAVRDIFPNKGVHMMTIWGRVGARRFSVSPAATDFIHAFDGGKRVKPISFWLTWR